MTTFLDQNSTVLYNRNPTTDNDTVIALHTHVSSIEQKMKELEREKQESLEALRQQAKEAEAAIEAARKKTEEKRKSSTLAHQVTEQLSEQIENEKVMRHEDKKRFDKAFQEQDSREQALRAESLRPNEQQEQRAQESDQQESVPPESRSRPPGWSNRAPAITDYQERIEILCHEIVKERTCMNSLPLGQNASRLSRPNVVLKSALEAELCAVLEDELREAESRAVLEKELRETGTEMQGEDAPPVRRSPSCARGGGGALPSTLGQPRAGHPRPRS